MPRRRTQPASWCSDAASHLTNDGQIVFPARIGGVNMQVRKLSGPRLGPARHDVAAGYFVQPRKLIGDPQPCRDTTLVAGPPKFLDPFLHNARGSRAIPSATRPSIHDCGVFIANLHEIALTFPSMQSALKKL
jgi:hypothetical protein